MTTASILATGKDGYVCDRDFDERTLKALGVTGATRAVQAESNAAATSFRLTRDEMDHLDRLSKAYKT